MDWFEDARKRYKIRREKPQYWDFAAQGFGYIQIPKVATRSIRAAFSESFAVDDFPKFERETSSHIALSEIRERAAGRLVFAFVRDPIARLYSAYVNKVVDAEKMGRRNILRCHGITFGMGFSEFVKRVSELDDAHIDRHLRSQAWFLADEKGLVVNFVGRLERFSDDWERLRERIPMLAAVGRHNQAAGDVDFKHYYSSEMLELTYKRYRKDFELFGY